MIDGPSFLFIGWIMNLAPYIAVARSCFAYHYMPGLLYAELLYCVLVNAIPGRYGLFAAEMVNHFVMLGGVVWSGWEILQCGSVWL